MAPRNISYTDLPGVSRLFLDYLYEPSKTRDFYARSPWEPAGYATAAAAIDYPADRRAALVAALRVQNGDHPSLDLLARPGTVVVATGQQVGLFTGPAYTVYKALTAARLAQRLTEQGLPAVPVFWLATEDHDFAEVNHCWVFDDACQPVRIEAGSTAAPLTPVGTIPVSEAAAGELRRALGGLPFAGQLADLVKEAYTAGTTFGASFQRLLGKLLAPYGLLYLDPLDPSARQLAAPLLARAYERSADLVRLVLERNQALAAAGYHAQVRVEPESSLLFLLKGGRRLPLGAGRITGRGPLAERAFAPCRAGLHAADGGQCHGAGGSRLHGPGTSNLSRAARKRAGGCAASRLHHPGWAQRQVAGPLCPVARRLLPG
jgi:hypothetical protein